MKKLCTIDANTLQSVDYEPISFLVEDLLPPGLHLLAGAPKIGKSWLALWLCLQVAQGKPLWNFSTRPCEVLYLCLEDSFQRIQSRLFDLTEDAPSTLHFAVMSEQLHNGLVDQMERFLQEHPTTGLVVIDTLQRIRSTGSEADEIKIQPEAAETVRMVYTLYLEGCGQKEIARQLNELGRKTPAQLRAEHCGREVRAAHKTQDGKYLWTYASVKNILVEEAYTGALVNHRSETNGGKVKRLSPSEWYRHESFFPVIVPREQWEAVQRRMKEQARPANGNKAKHRYAGLLTCQECGNPFVPMIRYWRGNQRVEYVCRGYHRNGKSYCSSHRIHEETLDTMVWEYLTAVRDSHVKEQEQIVKLQKMWALRKPILDAHILALQERIQQLEGEIDGIVMERISQCHFNIGDLSTEAADKCRFVKHIGQRILRGNASRAAS